jgi:hypothetical protein
MKTRTLLTLTTLALTLTALTGTTTANAFFEAKTAGATTGPATFPATTSFSEGTAVISCTSSSTTKATGFWEIQTSEETITEKEQKQPPTKRGPHEAITIEKWGSCEVTVGATHPAAKVSACRLQIVQPAAGVHKIEPTAKSGSIQTNCTVEILSGGATVCTITVPQSKVNHELTGITAENGGTEQVRVKANVPSITANAAGAGCATAGVPPVTKGFTVKTGINGSEELNPHQQTMV